MKKIIFFDIFLGYFFTKIKVRLNNVKSSVVDQEPQGATSFSLLEPEPVKYS
jgi:hypothetical protein